MQQRLSPSHQRPGHKQQPAKKRQRMPPWMFAQRSGRRFARCDRHIYIPGYSVIDRRVGRIVGTNGVGRQISASICERARDATGRVDCQCVVCRLPRCHIQGAGAGISHLEIKACARKRNAVKCKTSRRTFLRSKLLSLGAPGRTPAD